MMQKSDTQPPPIRLQCFHGNPAPPPIVDGWKRFLRFPQQATTSFWSLLGPALMEPANPRNKDLAESFSREHRLGQEDVVAALRSCDLLLRQASALDLDAAAFQQDLAALSPGNPYGAEIILSQYDATKAELRRRIIQESLADHGKVLVGLDWRLDNVTASNLGAQLDTTVVLLTLRYRDGERIERITLQLTPEALKELKLFCDRFRG
jgi:hypothetical protein